MIRGYSSKMWNYSTQKGIYRLIERIRLKERAEDNHSLKRDVAEASLLLLDKRELVMK